MDPRVIVAVTGEFVAVSDDAVNEGRVTLGDPAEHEERALTPRAAKRSSTRWVLYSTRESE